VRNLERAGVPRSTAKAIVGHTTESIYRRDANVNEAMLIRHRPDRNGGGHGQVSLRGLTLGHVDGARGRGDRLRRAFTLPIL
jgi:hypothetical protein